MATDAKVPEEFRVWLKSLLDHEIEWHSAWKRRQYFDIDGLHVPVISLEDLKAVKRGTIQGPG